MTANSKVSKGKKPARKKTTKAKTTARKRTAVRKKAPVVGVSEAQRLRMIREAAYFRAMKRGFQGGSPEQDWLEAEAEIEQRLQNEGLQKEKQ